MESKNTPDDTFFYRAFEDRHRGSRELIKTRLQQYLPFLEPLAKLHPLGLALDLGCGRGEWLEVANEAGLSARGVDRDQGMLAASIKRGLHVEQKDTLEALQEQPDASVCAVSAFHVVEHITFDRLQNLVREAMRVLVPGGLLILETPNPENLVVGTANFYLDPTHIRPIPPLLLEFLPEHYGFFRYKTLRLQESATLRENEDVRLIEVLSGVSPDYAVIAQKGASKKVLKQFNAAFVRDYGITLGELCERYEIKQSQRYEALNAQIAAMQPENPKIYAQLMQQLHETQAENLSLQQELLSLSKEIDTLRVAALNRERAFIAQLGEICMQYLREYSPQNSSRDIRD